MGFFFQIKKGGDPLLEFASGFYLITQGVSMQVMLGKHVTTTLLLL